MVTGVEKLWLWTDMWICINKLAVILLFHICTTLDTVISKEFRNAASYILSSKGQFYLLLLKQILPVSFSKEIACEQYDTGSDSIWGPASQESH